MFEINGKNYVLKYNLKRVEMIENEGYIAVNGAVLEALERDCPFFFQGA